MGRAGEFKDLTGQTFGTLSVIQTSNDFTITGKLTTYSYCYCNKYDCYNWVANASLLSNHTKCGTYFEYKPLPFDLIVDEELIGILRKHTWHNKDGYYCSRVYGERIKAHQFIWFLKTGEKVKGTDIYLDHINRNRSDNRFCNLRKATRRENNLNRSKVKLIKGVPSTSEFIGVSYDKSRNKWRAEVTIDRININLGRFSTEESAYQAKIEYIKLNCTQDDLEFRNI